MCYGQILESGLRKARKVHRCTGCDRPIRPGREYERVAGVDGRDFWVSKWHKRCIAVADVTEPYDNDGCLDVHPRELAHEHAESAGWKALLGQARKALRHRVQMWSPEKEADREAR